MTGAALDQLSDRPVKCRCRGDALMWTSPPIACIEFRQQRSQQMQTNAPVCSIKRVRVRSDTEWNPNHTSRTSRASIGGLPGASPSDRATWGWGTAWGGGIKGWGKVTRSGLLGTPDLGTF
ncbi:hypothetical protein BKD09_26745 [Bradyrhizobium japonicum]|uniref:Uncharacterized protein n=1 Tax=Bradyrhizobium japonicum TaxID=375 RepID=A0A1L3FF69_BRAJP|nr:hypothetical protein BKD09_26745 [Bradyrhizobium japonicum]